MTDHNDNAATGSAAAQPAPVVAPAPVPASTAPPPVRLGGVRLLAGLALLGSLAALAAVGWQYQQAAGERDMAEFRLQSAIRDQGTELRRLNERMAEQRADSRAYRREQQALVETLSADLRSQAQRLAEISQGDRTDWRLAELEYLLQLARQRLLLSRTANGVIELLETADQLAREIDSAELHEVRAALASDLAALRALATVDIEGIWLALNAAAEQVGQLRLVPSPEPLGTQAASTPVTAEDWRGRLRQGLDGIVARLSELVQIRRRDEAYQPLLSPQYEQVLRQHLALLFEQAQLALLAGREQLYREALQDARRWVERYFALDEAATSAALAQIDTLLQQTVAVELPRTLNSHQAMRAFVRHRGSASSPAVAPAPTADGAGEATAPAPAASMPAAPMPTNSGSATPGPAASTPAAATGA